MWYLDKVLLTVKYDTLAGVLVAEAVRRQVASGGGAGVRRARRGGRLDLRAAPRQGGTYLVLP